MIQKTEMSAILAIIAKMYPDAKGELNAETPFQLLVAVILSAQATDKSVNKVTPPLFQAYPTIFDLANADVRDVENIIRHIGLYKNKAKNIIRSAQLILAKYDGKVPKTHQELESLPGVGPKTANVVLGEVYGIPSLAVDTHVSRIAKRLGISSKNATVSQIEEDLKAIVPRNDWIQTHHRFIFFGRYHCTARQPKCERCELQKYCLYYKEVRI